MRQQSAAALLAVLLLMGLSATLGSEDEDLIEVASWCEDGLDNDGDGQIDEFDIHCGPDYDYGFAAPNEAPMPGVP